MQNSALFAVILAAAGASCEVEAWAADTMPVKTPPAAAASAPKTCTDGWGFVFTDCQLTWQGITIYGAEPAGADDAARGFASGNVEPMLHPSTIADGLRATLSERTLHAIRGHAALIGTASEAAIARAMRTTWERMKIVIEPSAAVPLACLLEGTLPVKGRRVGIIVTGGNVDLDRLPWQ